MTERERQRAQGLLRRGPYVTVKRLLTKQDTDAGEVWDSSPFLLLLPLSLSLHLSIHYLTLVTLVNNVLTAVISKLHQNYRYLEMHLHVKNKSKLNFAENP